MKKLTLFSVLAVLFAALSFTSCNSSDSSDDSSTGLPDQATAKSMLLKVGGYHSCGVLLPADKDNKIEDKDSIETTYYVNANDSSFNIASFPVSKFAKYFKDEDLAKVVAELPNQDLTGKLLPYSANGPTFGSYLNNIKFSANGKEYYLFFYGGYTPYSMAGYATNKTTSKQVFVMYMTLGAVFEGSSTTPLSNALKTQSSSYGSIPYTLYLMYNL